MNEFIVWDKEKNIFVPQGEIIFSFYGDTRVTVIPNCIEYIADSCHNDYDENRFKILKDIGLKDIDNKKIYADCSIVELEIDEDFSNEHFSSTESHKFIGVVRFDYFGARVEDLNDRTTIWFSEIENDDIEIKIIDTIQENKLGLIK